jgi:hypothetical protein
MCRYGEFEIATDLFVMVTKQAYREYKIWTIEHGLCEALIHKHKSIVNLILATDVGYYLNPREYSIEYDIIPFEHKRAIIQACISFDDTEILKKLLPKYTFTIYECLTLALEHSHYGIAQYLIEKNLSSIISYRVCYKFWDGSVAGDLYEKYPNDKDRILVLMGLAENKKINTYKKFVELYEKFNCSDPDMIYSAFVGGNEDIIKFLLSKNAYINIRCLNTAIENGNTELVIGVITQKPNSPTYKYVMTNIMNYNMLTEIYPRIPIESQSIIRDHLLDIGKFRMCNNEDTMDFIVRNIIGKDDILGNDLMYVNFRSNTKRKVKKYDCPSWNLKQNISCYSV